TDARRRCGSSRIVQVNPPHPRESVVAIIPMRRALIWRSEEFTIVSQSLLKSGNRMIKKSIAFCLTLLVCCLSSASLTASAQTAVQIKPGRDPKVAIDEEYTKKIREYTTEAFFNSPLTDYLPASSKVPTPKAVLGDVAGAPGILP